MSARRVVEIIKYVPGSVLDTRNVVGVSRIPSLYCMILNKALDGSFVEPTRYCPSSHYASITGYVLIEIYIIISLFHGTCSAAIYLIPPLYGRI